MRRLVIFKNPFWFLFFSVLGLLLSVLGLAVASIARAGESSSALAELIEKAKREGVVDATVSASLTQQGARAVAEAIKQKYGVDLKFNYTPSRAYNQISSQVITEHKTRVPPSYDLVVANEGTLYLMGRAGALEQVDWASLLPAGTPKEVIVGEGRAVTIFTILYGLLYDPKKVPPRDVPSSLRELADPKWKGKVVVPPYADAWLRQLWHMGSEEGLSVVRAIVKNNAIVQTWPDAFTRFTVGEYPMVGIMSDTYYYAARKRGVSAAFKPLGIPALGQHSVGVSIGARHPNAAKLLAVFLASPEATKIWQEVASNPNAYYPTLILPEFRLPEWQGIRPQAWTNELSEFQASEKGVSWINAITRILENR